MSREWNPICTVRSFFCSIGISAWKVMKIPKTIFGSEYCIKTLKVLLMDLLVTTRTLKSWNSKWNWAGAKIRRTSLPSFCGSLWGFYKSAGSHSLRPWPTFISPQYLISSGFFSTLASDFYLRKQSTYLFNYLCTL
jgi:hypothetical protein